jgi:hypothetical protein
MYERLSQERTQLPPRPEILFFDECILEKLNRTNWLRGKVPTPFLDDYRYEIFAQYILK